MRFPCFDLSFRDSTSHGETLRSRNHPLKTEVPIQRRTVWPLLSNRHR
jgi:hypothetical protein